MTDETLCVLRHIFDVRIVHATNGTSARDIVEYALLDYLECLVQFDDLEIKDNEKLKKRLDEIRSM